MNDALEYIVLINSEEQYSLWPRAKTIPIGWQQVGEAGSKQACLDYIKQVWVDLTPLSVRKTLEGQH